jgi:hypothetical protein
MSKYFSKNEAISIAKKNIETSTPNSYLLISIFKHAKLSIKKKCWKKIEPNLLFVTKFSKYQNQILLKKSNTHTRLVKFKVGHVLYFINNYQFQVFQYFKIVEPLVLGIWK